MGKKKQGNHARSIKKIKKGDIETLKNIANDNSLEDRYKQLAQIALRLGKDITNHQV